MARHIRCLKLASKPAQIYVRFSIIPLSQQANHVRSGIISHYVVAFVCLHFALLYMRVFNSFEELCIIRVAAVYSFARLLNPVGERIYKVIKQIGMFVYLFLTSFDLKPLSRES